MSPGFGAYSSAMTAPVSRPIKKPIAVLPLFGPVALVMTLALRVAFGDGQTGRSEERAQGREEDLGVADHADACAGQLPRGLSDRDAGEREQPGPPERPRPTERGA